jgi:uncharacterized membrane protein YdjX (TVP38/TMEM64 family)
VPAEQAVAPPSTALRVGALIAVGVGLLVARQLGLFENFSSPSAMKQVLLERGAWGYVVFIGAYAVLQPFGVPGTVFILAAPLVWPWPVAFALSMAGTMAASVIGFSFARFVARDWFERRIPARLQAYSAALAARGFVTVVTLRFIFWMPQILHAFLGVSRVGFWTHFWGSIVGYAVPLLLTAYFGERLFAIMSAMSPTEWLAMLGVTLCVGLGWWLWSRRRRAV